MHDRAGACEQFTDRDSLADGQQFQAAEHALALVMGRAWHLVHRQRAIGAAQHAVGERAAHVDPDAVRVVAHGRVFRSRVVASWSTARVISSRLPVMTTP